MKRAVLVYNPLAGDQSIRQKLDHIISRFQKKGILLQPFRITDDKNNVLAEVLKQNNYKFIVASGGDGTLNYISNLMLKSGISIPLGIIPSGTCNDFASILDISPDLDKNLDIILDGKTIEVDVGLVNEETYFLSSCAAGVFVDVSFNTNSELKKNFGPFAYYLKALSEVANMKSVRLTVETEKDIIEEDVMMFLILNGKHAGGFNNILKEADYSDGLMDIVLIKNCNHIDLASIFFNVLSNDTLNSKNVIILKAQNCYIKGSKELTLSIDGEKGPGLPVKVRFIHKALTVFARR